MNTIWPPRDAPETSYITAPPSPEYRSKKSHNVVILGSTGSIGRNALAIAASADSIKPIALAAGRNIHLLARQANQFRPPYLAVLNDELGQELEKLLPRGYAPRILTGRPGYAALAALPEADCVLAAQVGSAGLCGALAAALAGKVIALANKESLVIAGALLRSICKDTGAAILPVDSEHYALFQCLCGRPGSALDRLILTASGGPFLHRTTEEILAAEPEDALKHPNWSMGAKISIDSASLMNKGLEFIEAMQLYGVKADKIHVLVHPQSIVHSLVQFKDNSILGQFAVPDMCLPIGACLLWPASSEKFVKELDLASVGELSFLKPDPQKFPCLRLAMEAAAYQPPQEWSAIGVNPACVVLNAANEAAVEMFLAKQCKFGQIPRIIEAALQTLIYQTPPVPPAVADSASALALLETPKPLDDAARLFARAWNASQISS